MIPLSSPPTPNERALASVSRERITGMVGNLTLAKAPVDGLELLFKNGALLDPAGGQYTISETTVTLATPATVPDIYVCYYHARRT